MKKYYIFLLPAMGLMLFSCENKDIPDGAAINEITGYYDADEWSETLEAQSYFNIRIHVKNRRNMTVNIENFYNADITVYAELYGYKIRIPVQQVGFYEIEGIGSYYDNKLTLDYSVRDVTSNFGFTDVCNAICTRK
jgi:hypothetical protein